MILDSHCHCWPVWPFEPIEAMVVYPNSRGVTEVPDPLNKGTVEQLIFEMDMNDVDQAVVVCVQLQHNLDNNDHVAECVKRYPDRLLQFADIDGSRSPNYHKPGAAGRLEEATLKYDLPGFTHYIKRGDDGSWYLSDEGLAFFAKASELDLIASISCPEPEHLQPIMRQVAEQFPDVPFLFHHLGLMSRGAEPPYPGLKEVLASARLPNTYIKLSGPYYLAEKPWDYPYSDVTWIVRAIYEHYGPDRLCWGSDSPVVRDAMNYRQSLEWLRTHCSFIPDEHKERILGKNLHRLLTRKTANQE